MTQFFAEDNRMIDVTVIEAGPCPVLSVRGKNVQICFDPARESRLTKPVLGIFKKLNVSPRKFIREILKDPAREYKVGEELKVDMFAAGDYVDVIGISKGKGFQGGMKRWNWSGGPMTHGSTSHRRVGSIGSATTPGRVFKGHHMPGHMGDIRVTLQNLRVVKSDLENNLLLIRGAVPGCKNSYVIVRQSKKKGHIKPQAAQKPAEVKQKSEPRPQAASKAAAKPAGKK